MASAGSPSVGSPPLRRGLISCMHSLSCRRTDDDNDNDAPPLPDQDLREAMYKLIVGFYDEAFHRLRQPCETMPDLLGLLSTGGFCIGLVDPVSNIILNTLALLPDDEGGGSSSPPAAKRSRRFDDDDDGDATVVSTSPPDAWPGAEPWQKVANRCYHGLLAFLMAYFGCLTEVQAARYLYRADADLRLAVMLVQHDLYVAEVAEEVLLDPESDRTQAALEWAAKTVGHPAPSTLAEVMAIRLKDGDFAILEKQFSAHGTPLTADDVGVIHRILHTMMRPLCAAVHNKNGLVVHVRQNLDAMWSTVSTTEDTRITSTTLRWAGTPISSLQSGLPNKLQDCLRIADGQKHNLKTPCSGVACDYVKTLNMYLHGMIHNFYIKALTLMPTPCGSLMRSFLTAGHCYGSMDPLSNIVVNSIWYHSRGCFLPLSDREKIAEYNDVLDPLSLLRAQVHSLKGLTELAAAFADPRFPVPACALETLCSAKCDIVNMLLVPSSSTEERFEKKKNPFHEAAMAAGHPLPLQLGELHQQLLLMPEERSNLLSLITAAQTSGTVLPVDDIASILDMVFSRSKAPEPVLAQAPELSPEALRVVSSKRSVYEGSRIWFRSNLETLLKEYRTKHFWGPKYELDIIFGVEESKHGNHPFCGTCYHVNFTATSDLKLQRTLFYAEFWDSPPNQEPEFCCPLPNAYAAMGRCYYDVHRARKIVYPDDAKYIPDDITYLGTGFVDEVLQMDFVYFGSERDVELAEKLNMMPIQESDSNSESEC